MMGPMTWSKQFYLAPRRGLNPLLCRGVASAALLYTCMSWSRRKDEFYFRIAQIVFPGPIDHLRQFGDKRGRVITPCAAHPTAAAAAMNKSVMVCWLPKGTRLLVKVEVTATQKVQSQQGGPSATVSDSYSSKAFFFPLHAFGGQWCWQTLPYETATQERLGSSRYRLCQVGSVLALLCCSSRAFAASSARSPSVFLARLVPLLVGFRRLAGVEATILESNTEQYIE